MRYTAESGGAEPSGNGQALSPTDMRLLVSADLRKGQTEALKHRTEHLLRAKPLDELRVRFEPLVLGHGRRVRPYAGEDRVRNRLEDLVLIPTHA